MKLKTTVWDGRLGMRVEADPNTTDPTKRVVKIPQNYQELLECLKELQGEPHDN